MNYYSKIFQILYEGKSTGGDLEATFERLGRRKGHEDKNPNAKPGEPGYLRRMIPGNLNPDFPPEVAAQKKRKKRLQKKILTRAYKQEVAKNKITRANQPTMRDVHSRDSEGILRFDPDAAEKKGRKPGTATDIGDAQRQERERKDFKLSTGDTSDLSKEGLKSNLKLRGAAAVKRGRDSVR
jgi:hypothetical protein